jgi:hypothetical protein
MRKRLLSMLAVLGFALAGVLIVAQPANAYPGCNGQVRMQVDNWAETTLYSYHPALLSPATAVGDVNLSARLGYYNCPNDGGPHKVLPMWIRWCWANPDEHARFTGVTFNAHVYDDTGEDWNPGAFKVGDDGTDRNCDTQFAMEDHWLQNNQLPRWRVSSEVNVIESNDTWWNWKTNSGSEVNIINIDNPSDIQGGWHY